MCKNQYKEVEVKIPADLSHKGYAYWRKVKIDKCIADLVRALQNGSIDMRGSCCGHFEGEGDIHLQDGRVLIILDKESADFYFKNKSSELDLMSSFESAVKKSEKETADLLKDILDEFSDKDQILISKERIEELYKLLR
jgi:hypothetical protein